MNSKLIISALLSLMAVQVSMMHSNSSPVEQPDKKVKVTEASSHTAKATVSSISTELLTVVVVQKNASGYNELTWSISENNKTESFLIQRSHNGKNFRTIARRSPKENLLSYKFEDAGYTIPAYYRLIEVDVEGKAVYSEAVRREE
jgi:hypothetical protein